MNATVIETRPIPLLRRQDLETTFINFRGEPFQVVHDPISLKYHHLQPSQSEVWNQLNGENSIEQIRNHLARKFPTLALKGSDVQRLITDLHQKGLTRSGRLQQAERLMRRDRDATHQKWLSAIASPFFIKLPPVNPAGVVTVFSWLLGWLYSRPGFFLASIVIVGSWLEAAVRFETLTSALPTLQIFFGWPNLLWLWMMIGVSKFIHEMGHAVACRHVGRRCHGIGVGLLVFSPTLYCDATDSWMCPSKWKRMLVAAGGMYVELFFGAIALFVWSHTHPGRIHALALNVAAVSTVSTVLFNANPLIRFDGYYILSDWIEIPNLQEKSSRLLYRAMAWCLGITTEPNVNDPKTGQGWFIGYAILSFLYRWFIMGVILLAVYSMVRPYRIESLGGVWVVAIIAMSSIGIVKSWKNVARTKKEGFFSRRRLITTVCFAAFLAGFVGWVPLPWWATLPVQTEFREPGFIFARVDGRLRHSYVQEGDQVEAGDVIAKLSNPELDDQVRELRLTAQRLSSEVESLELLDKHADLVLKQQELNRAERRLKETVPLLQSLEVRSPIGGTLINGQYKTPTVSDTSLPAWSGWPLSQENRGSYVPAGTRLAQVVENPRDLICVCYVTQGIRDDLEIGMPAQLRLDLMPHDVFDGKVSAISPVSLDTVPPSLSQRFGGRMTATPDTEGNEVVDENVYRITLQISQDDRIAPQLRGRCLVGLKSRTLWLRLTRFIKSTFFFRM